MGKISDSVFDFFKKTDKLLWLLTLSAVAMSLLLILSMQRFGSYNFFRTQLIAVLLGAVAAIIISAADYRYLLQKWYFSAITAAVLAGLVFVFGIQVAGTDDTAWIELPGGFTVQPSEFIKICFIITFSKHLSYLQEKDMIQSAVGVISLLFHALLPIAVIHIQGDDGTAVIFGFMFLIMSYIAGVQLRYFIMLAVALIIGVPVIWSFFMNDEHRNRILALFDIDGNAMTNYGWQQYQGKVSIAGGGVSGSGLFNGSRVEYGIVPEQQNDFIFTVAGEELGFIGCILILAILFGIIIKVLADAYSSTDLQGKFVCSGVFAMISSQTIINLGMVLGFLPVVGITLPLFSSGGTSALSTLISIGLVQSVMYHNEDDMDSASVRRGLQSRIRI